MRETGYFHMIAIMDLIPASVLVIENHPLMREALCTAISDEPDLSAGMKAANGTEALQMLRVILPDIILLAMGNPGMKELESLKTLLRTVPAIPILAFIANEVDGQERAALDTGACTVLTKAATRSELILALRQIWMKTFKGNLQDHLSDEASKEKSLHPLNY